MSVKDILYHFRRLGEVIYSEIQYRERLAPFQHRIVLKKSSAVIAGRQEAFMLYFSVNSLVVKGKGSCHN